MKASILTLVLSCLLFQATAQDFKNLRFDEDYGSLNDSSSLDWYQQLKYARISRSGSTFFSFGGEMRYQFFKYENEDWGDAPPDDDGYMLSRMLLHADLHINRNVRLFTQIQSSMASGRDDPSPVEQNELDLHQFFVDIKTGEIGSNELVFRIGRQELSYGSARLVSTREGPNNRQAFDGVKLMLVRPNLKSDVFYSDYVISQPGIFNDEIAADKIKFAGIYNVLTNVPIVKNIDLYYFLVERKEATWNDVEGDESRHSVGSRIWGKSRKWQYDFEGIFQFGDVDNSKISAWTLSVNTNYTLGSNQQSPSIGLKTEIISGDRAMNDAHVESFNPLFPRGAYFGYAALIGPSNLLDIHPSVNIPLGTSISIYADYDIFWRYSINDGIYNPGTRIIYPAGTGGQKFIGQQLSGVIEFSSSKHLYIRGEATWFMAGPYIKAMGEGKDIFFTGITATIKF